MIEAQITASLGHAANQRSAILVVQNALPHLAYNNAKAWFRAYREWVKLIRYCYKVFE
jgi:hypothetical protein